MVRRFRQVLVALVIVGTLLIAWNAVDAQSALPGLPPRPSAQGDALDRLFAENHLSTPSGAVDSLVDKDWTERYERPHSIAAWRIWERAAKSEFVLIAAALCVWLVLPRANAPRGGS